MKFSIIIPAYNVKNYLDECLQSVLKQTFSDYEIIVVDDGSTDGSGQLIDQYAEQDIRIRVIHQINAGLSGARNTGVHMAKGDYLMFLDADDCILGDTALEKLSVKADGCDIVTFLWQEFPDGCTPSNGMPCMLQNVVWKDCYQSGRDYLFYALSQIHTLGWYAPMRIYRKEFWLECGFEFPVGRKYEDSYLVPRILIRAAEIKVEPTMVYGYRKSRVGSITATAHIDSELDKLWVARVNIRWAEELNDINDELKKLLLHNFSSLYYQVLNKATLIPVNDRALLLKRLYKDRWVCQYSIYGKQRILAIMVHFLGVRWCAKLLGIRRKIKYGR